MPLPFIIAGLAAVAGAAGIGSGIHGGVKMKEAKDTMELAKWKHERAVKRYEERNKETTALMDSIGKRELKIVASFKTFSDIIEQIQGRPDFNTQLARMDISKYQIGELRKISDGAVEILGGITTVGIAGSLAASGVTAAVTNFGVVASTGTAIPSLSGAAATNATLAAIGGGSLASGGGGMALGSAILGGATLGAGLLVGGAIMNLTGSKLSDQADEAYRQASRTEEKVDKIVSYLKELTDVAESFELSLMEVEAQYKKRLARLDEIVNYYGKKNWSDFTGDEKELTKSTVLLVGMLNKMCKTKLVVENHAEDGINIVNKYEVRSVVSKSDQVLNKVRAGF